MLGGCKGCEDLRGADRTHAADPEDLPLQVVLATGNDNAHLLDDPPHIVILDTLGILNCSDRRRVVVEFVDLREQVKSPNLCRSLDRP